MHKQMSICPSDNCRATKPPQQLVGPTVAAQAGQPSLAISTRCTGCGCVWLYGDDGRSKVILGHFDESLGHYGWKPAKNSSAIRGHDTKLHLR